MKVGGVISGLCVVLVMVFCDMGMFLDYWVGMGDVGWVCEMGNVCGVQEDVVCRMGCVSGVCVDVVMCVREGEVLLEGVNVSFVM